VKLSSRELLRRAAEAREHYGRCDLCAHACGVDRRKGPAGICQEGDGLWLAGAGIHHGEEPQLVPSGLILIAGCNLSCESCETWEISLERRGAVATSASQLAALLLDLQKRGAVNANFVTPTHVLPALLDGLAIAAGHGFSLPVVWNCGGYESIEALRLLDGVVDVYLPDAKYGDDAAAYELSGCKRYTAALLQSLEEMHRQAEVIVRHLVLPAGVAAPEKLMPLIAGVSEDLCVNVLSQYRPVHRASRFPVIARGVTPEEVRLAVDAARSAGLRRLMVDGKPA
jgi:putative pyruvate formate lyase activating enzyme